MVAQWLRIRGHRFNPWSGNYSCGDWAQRSPEPRQRRLPGKSGRVLTYLTSRSCGVAPCRPCPPSGHPSLDPSGTVGEAQSVSPEWARRKPRGAPHPAAQKRGRRELPPWRSCSQAHSGTERQEARGGASPKPSDCAGQRPMHHGSKRTRREGGVGPRHQRQLSHQASWIPPWALSIPKAVCGAHRDRVTH